MCKWIGIAKTGCKMKKRIIYLCMILGLTFGTTPFVRAETQEKKEDFNLQKTLFGHLGDEYGWKIELPHGKSVSIPLPVILHGRDGWHCFSSSRLQKEGEYEGFRIATEGEYEGKIVGTEAGEIYRPLDLSVTKDVLALGITALVVMLSLFPLVGWYRRNPLQAPRRGLGIMETMIGMVYDEVIVPVLGKDARRFAPYLLTLFFFILFSNLLGLIVIFPGGANIMGNISVTLVLAVCTFVVVNVGGTKKYWKEVVWPEVPRWLKFPLPIMPLIEVFGVFTKPMALMIRLFANMMAGHLITLVLISLIFVFSALGTVALGSSTIVAVVFGVFMNLIDLLICFIQAYVFMMLSTIFISLARPDNEVSGRDKRRIGVE